MKSKRVLLLIPHLGIGGTEVQTLNLAKALVLSGHKVTTLCLYRCIPKMVEEFKNAGSKVICISPMYNHYDVPINYHKRLRLIIFLYKILRDVLHKEQYDVIHVQYMTPMATAILVLKYMLHYRNIIVTSHTNADIYKSLSLLHFIEKHITKAFTCITQKAEEGFFGSSTVYEENLILGKHNHFTIYNALPYGMDFAHNNRYNHPEVIGVVSRLEPIKGMDLVIPAFAEVKKKYPEVQLIVVGDGTQKKLMEQQAKQFGVTDAITWAGRQPQEELHKWYGQMDIVLMPSRSEGFGLTAIEAMANGCVVVASNTGGLPEVVKDGEVGLLHQVENASDLAAKINRLLEDNPLYMKCQQALHDYVQQYSFNRYADIICSLYSKL